MKKALAAALALALPSGAIAQVLPLPEEPLVPGPALATFTLEPGTERPALPVEEIEPQNPLEQLPLSPLAASSAEGRTSAGQRALRISEALAAERLPAEEGKRALDARWDRSRAESSPLDLPGLSAAPLPTPEPSPGARSPRLLLAPGSAAGGAFAGGLAAAAFGPSWLKRVVLGQPVSTWLLAGGLAVGSWFAARAVRAAAERLLRRSKRDPLVQSFLVSASGYAVYVLAAGAIAHALGVDLPTLLGSLGVSTLAASFALKGVFGNVAGLVSIVLDRPFGIGEKIQVGASAAYRGVVRGVSLARTQLAGEDGSEIDVPNSMFIENAILKLEPSSSRAAPSPAAARRSAPWWAWPAAAAPPAAWLALTLWKGSAPTALGVFAVAGTSWLAARGTGAVVSVALRRSSKDPLLKSLASTAAAAGIYLAAGVAIAHMLGVNLVGLIGSLSVTSMAVGYILRAPLSNVVGGLTILERRPRSFAEGDKIQIGSDATLSGIVERISLTRTFLKSGETRLVVPNLMFIETPIAKKPARPSGP